MLCLIMPVKKEELENLVSATVRLVSFDGAVYGTLFKMKDSEKIEFIYRISKNSIGSIYICNENVRKISDKGLFLKLWARTFCHSKLTPFIRNHEGYKVRSDSLLQLESPIFEDVQNII